MPQVKLTKHAEKKINSKGKDFLKRYNKQKSFFEKDPSHPSLDFQLMRIGGRYPSFKITNQFRALMVKNDESTYTVFDVGDYHNK